MTKRDLNMLERIFTAEINGHLPFQSKSKHMIELHKAGLIEPMTRTLGRDRFGAIEASGWTLHPCGENGLL